jgi:hypothetical protein
LCGIGWAFPSPVWPGKFRSITCGFNSVRSERLVVFNELNCLSGQVTGSEKYHLAKPTLLEHNGVMTDSAVFKTDVVKDVGNPNRFRWNIYENQRVRDKSFYSFATRREAQNDADKFVRKLDSVWPGSKE